MSLQYGLHGLKPFKIMVLFLSLNDNDCKIYLAELQIIDFLPHTFLLSQYLNPPTKFSYYQVPVVESQVSINIV